MKNRIAILLLLSLMSISIAAHSYVATSVLGSGRFVKIQVSSSGLYGISYDQLKSWGLNPQHIRVLGYGGSLIPQNFTLPRTDDVPSIPFYMHTGSDGVFNSGDYILFYAKGPVDWEWNGSSFSRTRNCYADYGCYFLSDNAGEQRLMQESEPIQEENPYSVYTYTALQLHEIDQFNLIDVIHGKEGGGREWYGERLTPSSKNLSVPFTFQDVDTQQPFFCRVDAAASANASTTLQVEVEGVSRSGIFNPTEVSDFYTRAKATTITIATAKPTKNALSVKLTYQSSVASAQAYINYVDMQVPCLLHLRGNSLFIRNTEHIGDPTPSLYHLTGADNSTQIWNMTNPLQATRVPTIWKGDTLCWMGDNSTVQLFVAVRTSAKSWSTPAYCGTVGNQNLHQALRGKQHIIITPEEFRPAAERLKQVHEQHTKDQQWWVVSDTEVFNEFSSGTPDASAFRWMMKYLYDTFQQPDSAPRSLLLFGDGSFDNRRLLRTSGNAPLLTYQAINSLIETDAYATDDYFGFMEDKSGMSGTRWSDQVGQMQISVGRLPVNTYEEAENVVTKIANFLKDENAGSWKQQLCFLADDGDHGTHTRVSDAAAELVRKNNPNYVVNKVYLDSYEQEATASGESYPLAYNRYVNMLQSGVSLMDYSGHGSANNICSEMFLTRKQVEAMNNTNQGVWMLATCNFAHFDQADQSTAELAVLNPNGGAIAVISADRTVYATENEKINNYFCQALFEHNDPFTYPNTIGDALRIAKNRNGNNMNKMPYVLLGDPSLSLNYPTQYQVVVSDMPDTLRALDLVTIHGFVGDTINEARTDTAHFNGRVYVSVYDKIQSVRTRDNDEADEQLKQIMQFWDYPNKIFVGATDVEDGTFTFSFRMPKDIRYNIDNGRMVFYALGTDSLNKAEALGYCEQFKVGGSLPWTIDDKEGPEIQLYLNTPLFHDGDEVNKTPHFFADLYDENGINTIGSGIGHDLLLVIDNDMNRNYVVNDYYTSENNSYQRGTVSYILPEMNDGHHTLSFRAWDLLNNATTKTIGFSVNGELGPVVKSLIVYPNPVSEVGTLYLKMQNDRPDDMLSIHICFYDMVGHNVWSTTQTIDGETIALSMSEATLPPGTYIYQFTIQTATQSSKRQTGRLIVY